ncbi:MAG TPA: cellulase family glycosylhydrolase [Polyangiaceae bacterium]|nr:cellulase family glycosylhydrolase [Polyangiaceae bacterium]
MRASRAAVLVITSALTALSTACGSGSVGPAASSAGSGGSGGSSNSSAGTANHGGKPTGGGGTTTDGGADAAGGSVSLGGRPAGWLYTDGNKVKVSDGKGGGTVWVGRGVNTDDIFFCGYNDSLWMPAPGDELKNMLGGLLTDWKPTFIRLSLGMASHSANVSWLTDVDKYQAPMLDALRSIGKHAGVYLLLVVRSDASMIGQDMQHGDPEATGIPSDSKTTPDKAKFPSGTDPVYTALVDAFKNDAFVAFGLTNEPGGNLLPNDQIRGAMDHAVSVIRAEEDKLGVPHHLVSVQGQSWTSDISFYAQKPLAYDNVVYEVHGYPPAKESYTYDNLPVIIGEYGSLDMGSAPAFYDDIEAKQIPNLAWDFDPFSDCAPDLLQVNTSSTNLVPTDWGTLVKAYLLGHAK